MLYIQQFILMAHVSPWRPHLQNSLVIKEALKPGFNITKHITDFQHKQGYDFTTTTITKNRVPRPTVLIDYNVTMTYLFLITNCITMGKWRLGA